MRLGGRPGVNRRPHGPREEPLLVLLLPRALEDFALREQAEHLLEAPGAVAVDPARLPYGAVGRLPTPLRAALAAAQAARLVGALPGIPRAVAIFHPFQLPLAEALLASAPGAELWYGARRSEGAPDAGRGARARVRALHEEAAGRSDLSFATWDTLGDLGREAGRALNRPLFERMEALGVESGRLGSERRRPGPDA